jgi:hypothetical protein
MVLDTIRESYSFSCDRCGATWSDIFDVRSAIDYDGNEWRVFLSNGVASPCPERGMSCPTCGGFRVRLLPRRALVSAS